MTAPKGRNPWTRPGPILPLSTWPLIGSLEARRPTPVAGDCACGLVITVRTPSTSTIRLTVQLHNRTPEHETWRGELEARR